MVRPFSQHRRKFRILLALERRTLIQSKLCQTVQAYKESRKRWIGQDRSILCFLLLASFTCTARIKTGSKGNSQEAGGGGGLLWSLTGAPYEKTQAGPSGPQSHSPHTDSQKMKGKLVGAVTEQGGPVKLRLIRNSKPQNYVRALGRQTLHVPRLRGP